ncbi:MAG: hypothetical protein KFB95_06190 [Simkaniaceae bacterium]|nr:MAG: hypothetical protein KFB95_06190 [Simkaniaceae bacterium]
MDKNLNNEELRTRVATLESQVDLLEAELTYLNGLLVEVGFPEGIETLKATAEELLAEGAIVPQEHLEGM